jgi:hypothetical protein
MGSRNSIKGMHNVRTMGSIQKGGSTEKQDSAYIDLYMLGKEEKRMLEEKKRIELRLDAINTRLNDINDFRVQTMKMNERPSGTSTPIEEKNEESPSSPEWKVMPLRY